MKISCCWMYAITKYGYPPSIEAALQALGDMSNLGFSFVEMEGVGEENMVSVHRERRNIKKRADDLGLHFVNFCPVLPEVIDMEPGRHRGGLELFELAVTHVRKIRSYHVEVHMGHSTEDVGHSEPDVAGNTQTRCIALGNGKGTLTHVHSRDVCVAFEVVRQRDSDAS